MPLTLNCPDFPEGGRIPERFTCEGDDLSPPLSWTDVPEGTRSFALICADPDAPAGTWYHWGLFDIPADQRELRAAMPSDPKVSGMRQAVTDFKRPGYGGPCPPRGHGVHHYGFRLMALDVASLPVPASGHCRDVEHAAEGHVLEAAVLTGTYSR
ncbi:MAG: YbhB/YbcL family Raf kinase inhibitor-like protein [Rhodospirillales bacterium]|nr:MAG: YbhB/YbcL family Raf kinase inhibitor-like protein [Rhodospirillales bacterium]